MTQKQRILRALRDGPVRATAFSLPNVIDDGPPIYRVAARIQELRDAGHHIDTARRDLGAAVYTLVSEPDLKLVRDAAVTGGEDDRDAPHGGPTDPAGTAASDWEAAGGHHLAQDQFVATSERTAATVVDTPDAIDPSGGVGQLWGGDVEPSGPLPHWKAA